MLIMEMRDMDLSERKRMILAAIIDDYIETAEPVGSRTIAKRNLMSLSPATIRNEMADLEDMGYLDKPHTSAGRIPSTLGYRFYVDSLMHKYRMTQMELDTIRRAMETKVREMDQILSRMSDAVSRLTQYTAFATTPTKHDRVFVKSLSLIPIDKGIVLMVLVTADTAVRNQTAAADGDISDDEVKVLSNMLDDLLKGLGASQIDLSAMPQLAAYWEKYPGLMQTVQDFILRSLDGDGSQNVFLGGAANMFRHPEYKDFERAKEFLEFLDSKENIREIANINLDDSMIIMIGDENRIEQIKDCSLVISQYKTQSGLVGNIGIIGPTRMDYAKVASSLETICKGLGKLIDTKGLIR